MSHAAIARRIASISLAAASGFASAAAGVDAHRSTTRSADARRSTSRPTTTTSTARPVSASLAHSLACCAPQRADRAFCLVLRSPATAPPGVRSRSRATAAGLTGAVPGATMHSRVDPRHARSTGARRSFRRSLSHPSGASFRTVQRLTGSVASEAKARFATPCASIPRTQESDGQRGGRDDGCFPARDRPLRPPCLRIAVSRNRPQAG